MQKIKPTKKISIKIITLFPGFINSYASFGIVARAIKNKILKFGAIDLRKFGIDSRKTVDDRPYGGGLGMVLRADVVLKAIFKTAGGSNTTQNKKCCVVLLTPQGKKLDQTLAQKLAKFEEIIMVSGRYEGFDERVRKFADFEVSIGDYVLMGGELPALAVSESVLRFVPGVLGKDESASSESFATGLLEYPQYTKPEILEVGGKKMRVPKVLLSGHHAKIEEWRHAEALKRTKKRRPDLLGSNK